MRLPIIAGAVAIAMSIGGIAERAAAQTVPTNGQVTKIDESAGKITLRHEPIKNLDMDAMTMVFRVQSPAMLKSVKVGDKVVFEAARVNGAITVTRIRKSE